MRAGSSETPERLAERALDLELDLLAVRLADVQQELLFGGEELPVEEVLELPAVHREQLRAHGEARAPPRSIRAVPPSLVSSVPSFPGHWPCIEPGKIARNAGKFKALKPLPC